MVSTTSITTTKPTTKSIIVSDFVTGESVTTEKTTSPEGKTTTSRTGRSSSGERLSSQREAQLIGVLEGKSLNQQEAEKQLLRIEEEKKAISELKARQEEIKQRTIAIIEAERRGDVLFKASDLGLTPRGLAEKQIAIREAGMKDFATGEKQRVQQEKLSGLSSDLISRREEQRTTNIEKVVGESVKFSKEVYNTPIIIGRVDVAGLNVFKGVTVSEAKEFIARGQPVERALQNLPLVRVKEFSSSVPKGDISRGVLTIVPETFGQAGVLFGTGLLFKSLPPLARVGFGQSIAIAESSVVFGKTATPKERVSALTFGGLAQFGAISEVTPFIRGIRISTVERITGRFRKSGIEKKGFRAIELKETTIGIIEAKSPRIFIKGLPESSPLRRGGFGVREFQKGQFLGGKQSVSTSQIGLFKVGEKKILSREIFFTPQEPTLKIPITRESRLGLINIAEIPRGSQIAFGLPKVSQIGLEFGARVSRTGRGGAFRIGRGSELQATKPAGTILTTKKRLGLTVLKGQGVEIFEIKTTSPKGKKTKGIESISTQGLQRISGESLISVSRSVSQNVSFTSIKTQSISSPTASFSKIGSGKSPSISSSISGRPSTSSGLSFPSSPLSIPSPPITTISSFSGRTTTSQSGSGRGSRTSIRLYQPPRTPPPLIPFKFKILSPTPKGTQSTFGVSVKRKGKFQKVGTGLELGRAITIGAEITRRTVATIFKVTPEIRGASTFGYRTPKGFYRKEGGIFIEQKGLSLSTAGGIKSIQFAKSISPKRNRSSSRRRKR